MSEARSAGTTLIVAVRPVEDPIGLVAGALGRPRSRCACPEVKPRRIPPVEGAERADQLWLSRLDRLLELEDRRGKLVQVVLAGTSALLDVLRGDGERGSRSGRVM